MTLKGYQLKAELLKREGSHAHGHYALDEPAAVRVLHVLQTEDVWTDYLITELWDNCFFGECERNAFGKPWWAVKDYQIIE